MDYIGRALVADALEEWRNQLQASATVSALRDLGASETTLVDLRGAHPGGLAPLFAGRATALAQLIRDPALYPDAIARLRLIREHADRVKAATGVWTAAMVVGTMEWTDDGRTREVPLILRPVLFEPARQGDLLLTMLDEVAINPVVLALARTRGVDEGLAALTPQAGPGVEFDPRPLWTRLGELTDAFPDIAVRDRLFTGAFDDPEQRLLDDLDDMDAVIGASDILAATAGDQDAAAQLARPLPALATGDRDPFAERGAGDLDDVDFAALDLIATGRSVFLQAPPGSDPVGTVAAIAADAAASGRAVLAVGGSEEAVRTVAKRLDRIGASDTYVSGATASWNETARRRLLTSMTMGVEEISDEEIRAAGESLLAARHDLQSRFDALHRSHRPWDVSAFEAVQAVVRLISTEPTPATQVRLGPEAAAFIAEHGMGSVARSLAERLEAEREAAAEAAAQPDPEPEPEAPEAEADAATASTTLVPWWHEVTSDREEGAKLDEALATLVMRHLPKMRAEAQIASHETGMDEAPTLEAWADQVQLFADLRDTMEIFSPAVFHRSLQDLVAATSPPQSAAAQAMRRRDRRALRRRAVELQRPGRTKDSLHEHLVAANDQATRWRAHCSAGGWPLVPSDFDLYGERIDTVLRLWSRIAVPVARVSGEEDLLSQPWDHLASVLERLAEGVPGTLEEIEEVPVESDLEEAGLGELIADLSARAAGPEQVRRDLEFAWWASAFDAIVSADPRLTEEGALGRVVEEFLVRDGDFARARVGPLMRAVAERRRLAIARHPAFARDLFAMLVEGADAPYRTLWRDFGALVTALRPVALATAEQVSRLAPPARCVDLAVVFASESLALAETVPALARARQVVVVGDSASATRSAVAAFARLLPHVTLHALPQPRDPRVTAVLGTLAYGRSLSSLPAAGEPSALQVTVLDAAGRRAALGGVVETTATEVTAVVDLIDRTVHDRPRRDVAVVAGTEAHAEAIRLALEERGARVAESVTVVALGAAAGIDVDEVVLALGFAPDADGAAPAHLGLLSEPAGAAALAQAMVASHESLHVVSALDAASLTALAAEEAPAVAALRDLMLAASSYPVAPERPEPAPGDWLLSDIAARLRARGYTVRVRYGSGADTIPLVVGDESGLRVAVVTDEAALPSGTSVRDRMRRQYAGLECLGWTVVPLWTLDVFMDPDSAVDRIASAVDGHSVPLVWEQPTLDLGVETSAIRVPAAEALDAGAVAEASADDETEPPTGATPALRPEPGPTPEPAAAEAPDITLGISVLLAEQLLVDKHEQAQERAAQVARRSEEESMARQSHEDDALDAAPVEEQRDAAETDDAPEGETTAAADADAATEEDAEDERAARARRLRPAGARGASRPLIPTRAREDMDEGWGGSERRSSRDEEILREKPPHW